MHYILRYYPLVGRISAAFSQVRSLLLCVRQHSVRVEVDAPASPAIIVHSQAGSLSRTDGQKEVIEKMSGRIFL